MHYKVAVLWLLNESGELLLAKRSDTKIHDPGLWGVSVTGKLEAGETANEALARETEEELGLKASSYKPVPLFEDEFMHPDGAVRKFSIFYAVMPKNEVEQQLHIDEEEVAETKWASKADVK